jgi:mono/diheme cytochrome c family protein
VTPPAIDGAALYSANCASCHGAINAIRSMSASNREAADFRRAINANRGGMGFLASLTDAQLQAIAAAIAAANP